VVQLVIFVTSSPTLPYTLGVMEQLHEVQKPEAPRSIRKVLVAAQRKHWWDPYTERTHQQFLQLVTVIQER